MSNSNLQDVIVDLENNPVEKGGNVYHPIPFDEFAHLKTSSNRVQFEKKWQLIHRTMLSLFPEGLAGKKVLDVGANAGFFSFSLANAGAKVTSFEPHPRYSIIGPRIIEAKGLPITWHGSPFDATQVENQEFDLALMLSVFQWMSEGDERLAEASEQLMEISKTTRYLFFELGYNHGKSCVTTSRRNHYGQLIDFLRANTDYTAFRLLGTTKLWHDCKRYLVLCSNDDRRDDNVLRRLARSVNI